MPAEPLLLESYEDFLVDPPLHAGKKVREKRKDWSGVVPIKRDYLQREARNRSLGLAGELLVMEYEAQRLHNLGARSLADKVEHVSKSRGDGAGYDILSFETDGQERFIEVKTTAYIAETPFFVSPNEVDFSDVHHARFHLYRLFDFRRKPQMFVLPGFVAAHCSLDPMSYRATLLAR